MEHDRPDPYAVLGVRRGATPAEITHAYRALLRRHHPDTRGAHPGGPSGGPDEADRALGRIIAAYAQLREAESVGTGVPPARPSRVRNEPPSHRGSAASSGVGDGGGAAGASPIRAGPVRWSDAADRNRGSPPTDEPTVRRDDLRSALIRWLRG